MQSSASVPVAQYQPVYRRQSHVIGLLVLLLILVGGGYAAYQYQRLQKRLLDEKEKEQKEQDEEEEARMAALAKKKDVPKHPKPLTPKEKEERDSVIRNCENQNHMYGSCAYDEVTKSEYLDCRSPYYGPMCDRKCESKPNAPRTYTPGTSVKTKTSKPQATCVCPEENHFADTNVIRGCKAGKGSHCKPGFHGDLCTESGDFKDCGPNGTQSGQSCVCKQGYDGPKCQLKSSRCNTLDPNATPNDDGSCTCSAGYISKAGTAGDKAVCNECDTLNGYYKKGNRCVQGTTCELNVIGTGSTASSLKNAAGSAKTFDMSTYGITAVENIQLKRTSGSGTCSARIHTHGGCDLLVSLPAGHGSLTSFPLEAPVKGIEGRHVKSITLGEASQVATQGAQKLCTLHTFDTSDTEDCPSASGNICAFYWTSVKP